MENLQVNLYSMSEAKEFLKRLGVTISDTWLRKRMEFENLKVYHIGKSDFFTETDLYRFAIIPRSRRGPKSNKQRGN